MTLHIAAEIGCRREVKYIGYFRERQRLIAQQTIEFHSRITVNPIAGREATDTGTHLGEVLGHHAEFGGVVIDTTVLAIVATFEHLVKAMHQR